jgi:hypothetical protein
LDPAGTIESYLAAQDVSFQRAGDSVWVFQLRGEHKHAIPVTLSLRERSLAVESFFVRRPLEGAGDFYRMLLARNMRASHVRFAADGDGDVFLVGALALASLDGGLLDEVLGEILSTADQMFDAAIEVGFASYLARDRAWREKAATRGDERP